MKSVKIILGSALTLTGVVTPLTTLTSCSNSWGKALPFSIGSTTEGPYSSITNECYDAKGNDYLDYLQTNYSNDQKNNVAYAYSSPVKYKQDGDAMGEWVSASAGWYTTGDSVFSQTSAKYKDGDEEKTDQNPRNQALSENISLVSTIGTTINTYVSNALQYATSQINPTDENDLKIAWGNNDFNHGNKEGSDELKEQNNTFYEYCFASSNLVGINKVKALLKTSALNFSFKDFPLPTYKFNGEEKVDISDNFSSLLDDNLDDGQHYWTTSKESKDGDYTVDHYDAVPVSIEFNNITQTYLNPTSKSNSFIVSDFYSNNKEIKDSVGSAWKSQMPKFTSKKAEDCIPTYSSFNFSSPTNVAQLDTTAIKDKRIQKKDLSKNTFIALMSYDVKKYKDPEKQKDNSAVLVNLQGIFPSYFLEIYKDDPNLYKDIDSSDDNEVWVINTKELNKKIKLFVELIGRTKGQGLIAKASDLNQESKNFLLFLNSLFADNTGLNTSNFIKTIEIK